MDNIGVEAYALCCLLPFIAFLTLAAQLYCHATPKRTLKGRLTLLNDDLLCNMQGLITITDLPPPPTLLHSCPSDKPTKQSPATTLPPNEPASFGTSRREGCSMGRETLTGCSAGLARMKLINERYLATHGNGGAEGVWMGRRGRGKRGKEGFRPTCLPAIVEGLQY